MPDKQKTLVILSPAFPANESDSIWLPSNQLFVKKLKENSPSLNIIVLSFNYPYHTEKYDWHGLQVISFNGMQTRKMNRLLLWRRVWVQLKKINKQQQVIGILSFWCGECALVGRYFANWHRIRHFCWVSGMDAKKDNRLVKLIRPGPDELIAMSIFLEKEFYRNHSVKPGFTIPIGIDPAEFPGPQAERDIDILGVGSLNAFKQYDVLIKVVKKLSMSVPDIKAVICGSGPELNHLKELVKELQLFNNISFMNEIPHAEVLKYMQRTRVFLHPSSYEGFGAVHLEALYAGASVISFVNPMELHIDRWHIAKDAEEMSSLAFELLSKKNADNSSVLLYSMSDTAIKIRGLFGAD